MNVPAVQTIRGYELRERIGAGGFGAVYRAYQPAVDRQVAVKVILPALANHPDFIRRFEAEAQLVARLEHLHIVPLYDYWREPDGAYLVMRWLRGGNLRQALQRGPWSPEDAARLLDQVASALAVAHRQEVVHRDVKPENILLDEEGHAYLTDFGIAKDLLQASQTETDAVTGSLSYISPEQARSELVTPQSDQYSLGVVLYEVLTGEHPFPDVSPATQLIKHLTEPLPALRERRPDLPAALDAVIQRATAKDPAARYPDALALAAAFREAVAGAAEVPAFPLELVNPYKGLRAFEEADAADFFGREALVAQLLARLGEDVTTARFLAVVGPSGSGKSSAVKAGLLPALRRGALPGSDQWFVVEMQPGAHPLDELELGLLQVAVSQPAGLMEQLRRDERGLLRAARLVLPRGGELLLVIDQFEELFTRAADPAESEHLLRLLHAAATDEQSRVRVVVTLRADFYDRPLLHPDLGPLMREHTEVVLPLTPEELAQAIQAPAERAGAELEPGLVAAIVADVSQQPGALPMLQYALTELFERREGRVLTHAAYQAIGGVSGALARRAEEVYEGLDEAGQAAARQVFLRLVTLGEGVEDTRRRVLRGELQAVAEIDRPVMDAVIDALGRSRLLLFDRDPATRAPTVEVAHEALLREWDRLREWLDESRADVRMQRLLAAAAGEWTIADRDSGYLLYGTRLAQFEGWAAESAVALTQDEHDYLVASVAARQTREAEEEARRQHELEQARALAEEQQRRADAERQRAEEQTRSASRLRRRAVYLGVALIVALIAIVVAGFLGYLANEQRQAALAQAGILLASQAEAELEAGYADRAVLLALEALENYPYSPQAEHALAQAVTQNRVRRVLSGHAGALTGVAWSPDGKRIAAAGGADKTALVWDTTSSERLLTLSDHPDLVLSVAWSPDGTRLATTSGNWWGAATASQAGSPDVTTMVWDATTGAQLLRLTSHYEALPADIPVTEQYAVTGVAWSPDGKQIATVSGDSRAMVWDAVSGQQTLVLSGHTSVVNSVAWSPDGKKLLTASVDGTAKVWDLAKGQEVLTLAGHEGTVWRAAWSPDGTHILTAGDDGTARVWDASSGEESLTLAGDLGPVWAVAWSPGGERIVTGSDDGSARIWDAGSGQELLTLRGHEGWLTGVAWSSDGTQVVSTGRDGTVRVWDAAPDTALLTLSDDTLVTSVAWSPAGDHLITGGGRTGDEVRDGSAIVWDAATGAQIMCLANDATSIWQPDWSPDGRRILTQDILVDEEWTPNTVRVWDAATGAPLVALTGVHQGKGFTALVHGAAWSPDSSRIVDVSFDGTAAVYDAATGQVLLTFPVYSGLVFSVGWSPDGARLATGDMGNTTRVWDAQTGQELLVLPGYQDGRSAPNCVAWSPSGDRLLTVHGNPEVGAADNSVRVWDAATGEELLVMAGHTECVWHGGWSPNGNRIVTVSMDDTARVWDAATGAELRTLSTPTDWCVQVAWSPDGTRIATTTVSNAAKVWPAWQTTAELIEYARECCVVRELTDAERTQFGLPPR